MIASLVDRIDALLPQTQCTKCGYPACRPYAEAIARGDVEINQCPPGGEGGIAKLAALLGREVLPLNPANGFERERAAALIDESRCIGCTLCIQACPVDAIVGAPKLMHTVLLQHCTGCELCIPPCPVDCSELVSVGELKRRGAVIVERTAEEYAAEARARYALHQTRVARTTPKAQRRTERAASTPVSHDVEHRRAAVHAALERARGRRTRKARGV